ncbi:MAG: hypothetical protein NC217_07005 [Muribaculaceae bacterium]|nr:hypothetical protein [Muribaculaceae bacterium]
MKTRILSALAVGALALTASAQNYKVVITGTDGSKTEYETTDLASIKFEEAPSYLETNYLVGAEYSTSNDLGNYYICFGSGKPDSNGNPEEIGDLQIAMELTAAPAEDAYDAKLPAGYYRAGAGTKAGEFNMERTGIYIRLAEGDEGVTVSPLIDGAVDVRYDGHNYDIRGEFTLLTGEFVAVQYQGPITFVAGITEELEFTTDQDVTFEGAQERYYANWYYPFASDATLQLYTGDFDENGSQLEGYWLQLDTYMPKGQDPANPTTFLPDGTYTVDWRETIDYNTQQAYSLGQGRMIDFWGQIYPTGSYMTYQDGKGRVYRGLIKEGTMTVSENSTKIEFDFITDKGIQIQGTYNGNLVVRRFDDPTATPDFGSTLTKDVTLEFDSKTIALSYNMGDYIKKGLNQYIVMITEPNMKQGDYLTFELMSDQNELPDGTYTINNEIVNYGGLYGFIDYGGNMIFSWYGDLDSTTAEGYQETLAPINGGTVVLSSNADGTRTFTINVNDGKGHTISGTYTGVLYNETAPQGSPAKVNRKASILKSTNEYNVPNPHKPVKPVPAVILK